MNAEPLLPTVSLLCRAVTNASTSKPVCTPAGAGATCRGL